MGSIPEKSTPLVRRLQVLQEPPLVPSVPAFDDAAVLEVEPGHPAELRGLARRGESQAFSVVRPFRRPPHGDVVALRDDRVDLDAQVRERLKEERPSGETPRDP